MSSIVEESKDLFFEVKENEAKYISGELDLNTTLEKTDRLYRLATADSKKTTASGVLQDSGLLQLQTRIVRQSARAYAVDAVKFDPRAFSIKMKNKLYPNITVDNGKDKGSKNKALFSMWEKLGEHANVNMNVVPTFSFLYGTFDVDPASPVKRKERKKLEKDKLGDLTKPEKVNPNAATSDQDVMLADAERVFSCFLRLVEKSPKKVICFYEFVTDPKSFTRTVENIFLVSLLVKEGYICIVPDDHGMPCLKPMSNQEKANHDGPVRQSVLSMTMDDWKDIVKTFNFQSALLPPRKTH